MRRDASTSRADFGGYASAEPFAKTPRALGVHGTMGTREGVLACVS
jgi:hypothetical protein